MHAVTDLEPRGFGLNDDIFSKDKFPIPFEFNHDVANVFDDMAIRSIPHYVDTIRFIAGFSRSMLQEGDTLIDLGCSTGSLLAAVASAVGHPVHLVGMDCSEPMIQIATNKLDAVSHRHQVDFSCEDVLTADLPRAKVVCASYLLQFLPVSQRELIFEKVYRSLLPGGLFVFSEKVYSNSPLVQETMTMFYEHFKRKNGYSKTEIERKKEALDRVLICSSIEEYQNFSKLAGFTQFETLLKWGPFGTFAVRKST